MATKRIMNYPAYAFDDYVPPAPRWPRQDYDILNQANKVLRAIAAKHGLVCRVQGDISKAHFSFYVRLVPTAANAYKMSRHGINGQTGYNQVFAIACHDFWKEVMALPGKKLMNGYQMSIPAPGVHVRFQVCREGDSW